MVWDTMPSLAAGRPVLSTVRILDWEFPRECGGCSEAGHFRPVYGGVIWDRLDEALLLEVALARGVPVEDLTDWDLRRVCFGADGFPVRELIGHEVHRAAHPLYVPWVGGWQQLLDARGIDVLMDEVAGVASSRDSMSLPSAVANELQQLRRADVVLRWTAPAWARADKIMRECSQAVTFCQGYLPKSSGGEDRLWRQRRMFRWKTYDATLFEDFTAGKSEQLRHLVSDWHWGPGSEVFAAYDTFDAVTAIGTVTEGGSCYRCGGSRRRPSCKCDGGGHQASPGDERGAPRSGVRSVAGVA